MKHDHPDKIIFLDIDGIINTSRCRYIKFDEEAMKNLEDILDDDTDMLYEQRNNFINTDALDGITKEHVWQAIKILNYDPNTQKDQNSFLC